ncbi:hypothetical protein N5C96_15405 [Delftia tsuruhatensis]|uniref:hypothetical protein n=1 Tax=Delftia tsuruhatensis TaxID=180282 RepID=UPI002444FD5D|nr:hypothetical protein [Delftia tsuruhatensis]MDH0774784.1 hypothetical protein [Delftia tsuruhatensis]MDH1458730.1 hypothetical protein [Delftia tsuruhatensis]MDH1826927.1 hypothetical protein [Delftia tsuruhatensis]WGG09463.1 hypothetical protein N5O86_22850 [Delftia tsuruhatensis]
MTSFLGLKVLISPDTPKLQLSEGCPVTPEFRVEMNAWMREFFGVRNLIEDGQCLHDQLNNTLHMNPRTWDRVRAAAEKGQTP